MHNLLGEKPKAEGIMWNISKKKWSELMTSMRKNITRWTVKAVSDLSRIMQENEQSEQHEHFYVYDQPPIIITDVVSGKQLYNMLHN